MANVELEVVDYKTQDIEEVSQEFVELFAQFSKDPETAVWIKEGLPQLKANIQSQSQKGISFCATGIEIRFTGFPRKPITIIEEDKMVLRPQEPRFLVEEKPEGLSSDRQIYLEGVINGVARRMHTLYLMDISQPPLTLLFPNEVYTNSVHRILVENMPLLEESHDF